MGPGTLEPELQRLGVLPLGVPIERDVVVTYGREGAVLAQGLAPDVQGLLVQRPGLRLLPLGL